MPPALLFEIVLSVIESELSSTERPPPARTTTRSSPPRAVRYTGGDSQFQVYGQEVGKWYHRVRASSALGRPLEWGAGGDRGLAAVPACGAELSMTRSRHSSRNDLSVISRHY
jgi:hypothetical protein